MSFNLILFIASIVISRMVSTESASPASSANNRLFAANFFGKIAKTRNCENVAISPLSIQTALAMLYLGAEGTSATELKQSLRLNSNDKNAVGQHFAEILKQKPGEAQLNIANKLYVSSDLKLQGTFNELAKKYFNSFAENVNFNQSPEAVKTINAWIGKETNNKITNLLQPGSVNGNTKAIIVNAIYFKGKWRTPFSASSTHQEPFWVSQNKSVNANFMYLEDKSFKYGKLPELDATAIEMPYKDSVISMMVILPNARNGLAKLEEKLISVDINQLLSRLKDQKISLKLPKFNIQTTNGFICVLKEMGLRSIFEDTANLSGIIGPGQKMTVSEVMQRAYIDVNEAGSEAAAASIVQVSASSAKLDLINFYADHPFVFAIRSPEAILFVGHIVKF